MENIQKIKNSLKSWIISVIMATICAMPLFYFTNGMFIMGIPKPHEVVKVIIEDTDKIQNSKIFEDEENIEIACNVSSFLNYEFGKATIDMERATSITYVKKDGTTINIAADENAVIYKGKTYPLKQKKAFVNIAEGIFWEN